MAERIVRASGDAGGVVAVCVKLKRIAAIGGDRVHVVVAAHKVVAGKWAVIVQTDR